MEKCEAASHCCIHMKAEFVTCFEARFQANWLWNIISRLGIANSISRSLKTYCDNSVAVFFSKNDKYSKDVKLMELKYFVVKEEVQKHDPLTKGLSPKLCTDHVKNMGIMCTSECWMVNVIINDYLILWVHYCASFWNPCFLPYECACKLWLWCRKQIMLLIMKDDIMFEPIIDFSLWGHIKEKDNTLVHGRKCVDWMTCNRHDFYYSYIFKYDEWWNQFIEGPLMRIMIYVIY